MEVAALQKESRGPTELHLISLLFDFQLWVLSVHNFIHVLMLFYYNIENQTTELKKTFVIIQKFMNIIVNSFCMFQYDGILLNVKK